MFFDQARLRHNIKQGALTNCLKAMAECIAKVVQCILFVRRFGVIGIAWGILLPYLVIALFFMLPATVCYTGILRGQYIAQLFPPALPAITAVMGGVWFIAKHRPATHWNLWSLGAAMAMAGMVYPAFGYIFCLHADERAKRYDMAKEKLYL